MTTVRPLYRLIAGKKHGPYSAETLRLLVKDGRISRLDRFSYDGVDWQCADQFPELVGPDRQPVESVATPSATVATTSNGVALPATFKATPSPSVPLSRPGPPRLPPSIGPTTPIRPPGVDPPLVVAGKSQEIWPILAVASVLLLLLGGCLLVYMNYSTFEKTVVALVDTQKKPQKEPPEEPADKPADKPAAEKAAAEKAAGEKAAAEKLAAEKQAAEEATAEKAVTDAAAKLPPVLHLLEILLTAGDQPARIQATLTKKDPNQTDDDFQKWIEKDATLRIGGVAQPLPNPLPGKPDKDTLIFEIPLELTPDRCTGIQSGAQGMITLMSPFSPSATTITEGRPITFRAQESIDTFHTDQLATKTALGVPSVIPLSKDKPCALLTFHPNAKEIQLVLLTPKPPKRPTLIPLRLKPDSEGKEKWSVEDDNSPGNKNVFEIDRSNPWSPKLKFNPGPSLDLGQLPSCKLAVLSGPKESPKCIAVLQLLQPLQPQGGEIRFERDGNTLEWKPIDTTNFPSDAVPVYELTGDKKITFTRDKQKKDTVIVSAIQYDKPENNPLANITYKCPNKGGKLSPDCNITNTSFFFKPDNLYEVDSKVLNKYLTSIKQALHTPLAISQVKTLPDMRKGLESLKTEYEKNVKDCENKEAAAAAPDKAKEKAEAQAMKKFFSDLKTAVESQLHNLDGSEKTIDAHLAFIEELEKATFEASVSWEVEPSEADKGLVEKLTEKLTDDQKTVHAVVPASK